MIEGVRDVSRLAIDTSSALALVPGPTWSSFEKFRKGGNTTFEEIPEQGVGTLVGKGVTYRVLRDVDFQHLVGLAADDLSPDSSTTWVTADRMKRARMDDQAPCLILSAHRDTRRLSVSKPPRVERFVPIHVVEDSIFLPVNPLFRHPANGQDY
jgi:hypothetical protein